MKILLLHGWLLERSGSNVYTASLAHQWAQAGHEVHLFCQERHPDRWPFISRSLVYNRDGTVDRCELESEPLAGSCTLHRADIGDLLPVFNLDKYEGFSVVKRFVDMTNEEIENYLKICVDCLKRVVDENPVDVAFANHVIPNPTILSRLKEHSGTPFAVFPHGSAIEYAVKPNPYLKELAREALDSCDLLIVGNQIVTDRIYRLFPERKGDWQRKHCIVSAGVDTSLFQPLAHHERDGSISRLLALPNSGKGKSRLQTAELCRASDSVQTDQDLLDLVDRWRGQYDYTSPDADLAEKLSDVNWQQDPILLYVGKLIAGKGVHDLFLALPELLKSAPGLKLMVVGESTFRETLELILYALSHNKPELLQRILRLGWALDQRDPKPLASCLAYVEKIGLDTLLRWGAETRPDEHVVFTGYLNHSRFSKLLPCADVSIFPSEIAEAYPLVLLESICAGVTPIGAYFEGLRDGVDTISEGLDEEIREAMRLSVEVDEKVQQIARKVPILLKYAPGLKDQWGDTAAQYSWKEVAERLVSKMASMRSRGEARKGSE